MAKESNIKQELLKQMNKNNEKKNQTGKHSMRQILMKNEARVKRMKKITTFAWALLVAWLLAAAVIGIIPGGHNDWWAAAAIMIFQPLLLIAVIFSISLYVRSRTLNMSKIQASLTNIEEQLKKLSQDK